MEDFGRASVKPFAGTLINRLSIYLQQRMVPLPFRRHNPTSSRNAGYKKRLDAIVEGASKLPIENQEYILTTIKGMLFTRNLFEKQRNPTK